MSNLIKLFDVSMSDNDVEILEKVMQAIEESRDIDLRENDIENYNAIVRDLRTACDDKKVTHLLGNK